MGITDIAGSIKQDINGCVRRGILLNTLYLYACSIVNIQHPQALKKNMLNALRRYSSHKEGGALCRITIS
jgi:hypothetical protein